MKANSRMHFCRMW